MTSELANRRCQACTGDTPVLSEQRARELLGQLDGWSIEEGPRLVRTFRFRDFAEALRFVNRVGEIAEAEDHHPSVTLAWGMARVRLWTHVVKGLTENDFILAAKVDEAHEAGV